MQYYAWESIVFCLLRWLVVCFFSWLVIVSVLASRVGDAVMVGLNIFDGV